MLKIDPWQTRHGIAVRWKRGNWLSQYSTMIAVLFFIVQVSGIKIFKYAGIRCPYLSISEKWFYYLHERLDTVG